MLQLLNCIFNLFLFNLYWDNVVRDMNIQTLLKREIDALTRSLNKKEKEHERLPKILWGNIRDHFVERALERLPFPVLSQLLLKFLHVIHDNKKVLRVYDIEATPLGVDVIATADDFIFITKMKKSELDIESGTDENRILQVRTILAPHQPMAPLYKYINLNVDENRFSSYNKYLKRGIFNE